MKRYADEIIICYDADEAGQKATARAIPLLREAGLNIRVLSIPNGKDPDEFIKSKGADGPAAFKAIIDASGNDVDYRLQKLRADYNLTTSEGRVGYLEAAARLISDIKSPIERDVYVSKLCKEFEIDKNAFNLQINNLSSRNKRENRKKEMRKIRSELNGTNDKIDKERHTKLRSTSAEESLLAHLINNPDSLKAIRQYISAEDFQNSLMKRYFEYFSGRIDSGLDPMNNVTADFSDDERSRIYQILSKYSGISQTPQALFESIQIIKSESERPKDTAGMTDDDISKLFANMRKNKK